MWSANIAHSRQQIDHKVSVHPFPMKTTYTWKTIECESTDMNLNNTDKPSRFSFFSYFFTHSQ